MWAAIRVELITSLTAGLALYISSPYSADPMNAGGKVEGDGDERGKGMILPALLVLLEVSLRRLF